MKKMYKRGVAISKLPANQIVAETKCKLAHW